MNASQWTLAALVAATAALATGCDHMSSKGQRMGSNAPRGADEMPIGTDGMVFPQVVTAGSYWMGNSRDGYMSRESSMNYKDRDGRNVDFSKADTDQDGRISEAEWRAYNGGR